MENPKRITQDELRQEFEVVKASIHDSRHFKVLYDKYYAVIFRFVMMRVSDKDLTADLVSEVFYKALLKLPSYRYQEVPFSAWLYRIAVNEIGMYFRKSSRQRVLSIDQQAVQNLWKEIQPDDQKENMDRLFALLENLDPAEMNLLELRIFEDRSFREVGSVLGMSEGNAKVKFYRLIEKLTKLFKARE